MEIANHVVTIYNAPGDEGTAYTLRLPDGRETVISETGDLYSELAHVIDHAFGDCDDAECEATT